MALDNPRRRFFTQFAARAIGGHNALNAGRCPTCQGEIKEEDFTDERSKKEYGISGMCQVCQNSVFGAHDE